MDLNFDDLGTNKIEDIDYLSMLDECVVVVCFTI